MNNRNRYVLSVGFAFALVLVLLWYAGIERIWGTITRLNPLLLVPIMLLYSFDWILRGFRWKVILKTSNVKLSISESVMLTLIGNMANIVVPAKIGDLTRVYGIKKMHNVPIPVGLSSIFFDRIFDFLAVLLIMTCLLLFAPYLELPKWTTSIIYGAYILAFIVFTLIIVIIKYAKLTKKLIVERLKNLQKIGYLVDELQDSFRLTVKEPKILLIITMSSIIIWILEAMVTYIFTIALNIHASLWTVILVILMANLTKTLPLTPGGIGPYEWTFSTLFVAFGLSLVEGTTIGVMDHLFKNMFTIIIGGLAASWLGIIVTKASAEEVNNGENGGSVP